LGPKTVYLALGVGTGVVYYLTPKDEMLMENIDLDDLIRSQESSKMSKGDSKHMPVDLSLVQALTY
jgi:hypothetical protein